MEDDGSVLLDGKTIANLRVVDLKLELEKRGLSKSGSKKDLVKRLKQQVEFEKLSQRKSTGDCDLKIELDADTEQNEFVQQYLAQQQKIYAQQKEVKRRVELEEIQKSGDEKESCDSTKGDEEKTEDESDTESKNEHVGKLKICLPPDKTTKDEVFQEAAHPASSSNIEGYSKNHISEDKHSSDSHTAKETFKEVNKDREKELSTAISSLLMVENTPVQDLAEDLSVDSDVKDVENDREKELSTAISSLLSVENSDKQVNEPEDLSVPDSGVIRTSHDDDREKDLATAVLSSLLVDQDVETKNEEYAEEPCEETSSEGAVAEQTSQIEPEVVTESKPSSFVESVAHTKTEVTIDTRLSSAVKDSSKIEMEVTTIEKSSSPIVEDTLKNKADVVSMAKSLTDVKESSQVEKEVAAVEDSSLVKTELTIETKSSVVEERSHMKTDACQVELNVTVKSPTSSIEKEASEIVDEKTSSDVTSTSPVDSTVSVEAKSSVCVQETSEVEKSVVAEDCLVNVKEGNVKDQDKSFEEKSPSVVQEPPVESHDNSKDIQEEASSTMNVSSVPYSLSDIQLPGSPATKPQTKSDSVHAQSDEEQTLNNTNSNISKKSKKLEGDMNGKASKLEVRDSTSKDIQPGSDSEKPCQSKIPEAGNSKEVKSDSSSGDEKVKSRDKSRKKKHDSSDDSRSPAKKTSASSRSRRRRNRSSSIEDRGRSRSKSPRGSKSSRRGRRRSPSSEKEHRSKAKHKKGGSKKEKSKKRDKRSPSSDRSPSPHKDRSPRKPYKVRRKGGNVSSDEELHSETRRESPKKDAKVDLKTRSGSSDDESNAKTHKEDTKLDHRKDRSVSSSDERNSRSRESQKKDSKSDRKDTSVSSGDERKSRNRSKDSPKRLTDLSQSERSISPEKDFKNKKDSEAMDVEQTRSIREKESPKKEIASDSVTSSPESSPNKISHSTKGDTIKELKRKHSVSSDEDSKMTESPVKKSKPIAREASPEPKESPEKRDFEGSKDELPASRRSRRTSSPSTKHQAKRTDSLKSRSPERVHKDTFSKRPPSPKETHSRESSPEKAGAEDDKKAEVSDGELPSSRESSPAIKTGERKPSTDSVVSKSGTMIVIRKEAPKQKLKIKRDNVVVVKKDKEEVTEKDREEVEIKSITETVETPEPIEEQKLEPGECPDLPPNTNYVRRKIVLSSRKQVDKPSDEPGTKKSKWGSFAASRKAKQTVSISTDSLKNWFPDFKILKEPDAIPEDLPSPVKEEHDVEMTPIERVTESSEPKMIAVTRRLQPLPSEAALKPPAEPIKDDQLGIEPTPILFVQNLVRPFTLLQLKDLLGETGRMVEDGFWIDKIKSKCFVTYETVEEAVKTRKILNGARWPMSNPKILAVSFSTEEELSSHRSGLADQPKPLPPAPPEEDQPIRREREGRTRMVVPLREWDKDKVSQDSPEKLDRRRDEDRSRDKKEPKKRGGLADETPAKLLDDLFQKTKAVPCIYWLPLTQEQRKERDERRKQVNQERERRKQEREQENKRPRSRQRETRRSSPSRSRSPVTRRR